jgi:hypothetical protein
MSLAIYIAVLLAGLVSVMLGLQLASNPPPASTTARAPLAEPIRHAPTLPAAGKPQEPAVATKPETGHVAPAEQASSSVPMREERSQTTAQSPHESTVPGCNISACETHYPRSFRAADCTYQPNSGPRRLCRK